MASTASEMPRRSTIAPLEHLALKPCEVAYQSLGCLDVCRLEHRSKVALHALELTQRPAPAGGRERLHQPSRLDTGSFREQRAEPGPLGPRERVVEVEQDGPDGRHGLVRTRARRRTPRTRRRTAGHPPRCVAPRSSIAPRRL